MICFVLPPDEAPYSIDVYEDWIYGTTYSTNKVFRLNKFGHKETPRGALHYLVSNGLTHTTGVLAVQHYKQAAGRGSDMTCDMICSMEAKV